MGVMFLNRLQLARQVRITNLIGVKVGHAHPHTVFHLEGADVVQKRSPSFVFRQVLGHMMGQKNVPGVATIHHPLVQVDARAGHVRPFDHIHHTTDRPAVNAHPDLQALIILERAADLKGALRRFLRTFIEHQSHAIAGRDFQYTIGRFSFLVLLGQANNPVEFINSGVLLVNGEFRVADDVEEENVRDLLFTFGVHLETT